MNSPVTIAASLPAAHLPVKHPIVLQPRLLDRSLLQDLHSALQVAPAVVLDFIWLKAIDPAGVALLKQAIHLAAQMGRSIGFHGATAEISVVLGQEQELLRTENLGEWQSQCDREFAVFLRDRAIGQPEAALLDGEIVFPRFGLATAKIA